MFSFSHADFSVFDLTSGFCHVFAVISNSVQNAIVRGLCALQDADLVVSGRYRAGIDGRDSSSRRKR